MAKTSSITERFPGDRGSAKRQAEPGPRRTPGGQRVRLTGLNPDPDLYQDPLVLNGIAYNPETKKLLVTGKCWPYIYEIDLVPLK